LNLSDDEEDDKGGMVDGGGGKVDAAPQSSTAATVSSNSSNVLGPIDDLDEDMRLAVPASLKRLNTTGRDEEIDSLAYASQLRVGEKKVEQEEEEEEDNVLCAPLDGLKAMNSFANASGGNGREGAEGGSASIRKIMKELTKELPKSLVADARGTIFVRYDADHPQYLRALITGAEGTVYSSGLFVFDIFLPGDYPNVPLKIVHVTKNANMIKANHSPGGFSPNLHADSGKVCLSLLGTHTHTYTHARTNQHSHTHTYIHLYIHSHSH